MKQIKVDNDIFLLEAAEDHGSKLEFDVETWHFLPYWVMKNEQGLFLVALGDLPKHVTDMIDANFKYATQINPFEKTK